MAGPSSAETTVANTAPAAIPTNTPGKYASPESRWITAHMYIPSPKKTTFPNEL